MMRTKAVKVPSPEQVEIFLDISTNRAKQDAKWGNARDRHLPLTLWQTVLSEEVGEVAKAILHGPIDGRDRIREELIDVATVAVAIIEALDIAPWGFDEDKAG